METKMEVLATSINDTAKALNLGRTSIYALIRCGKLKIVKVGRRTLVTTDSILRLIRNPGEKSSA
jgi:excisionase family DNA binding protein